MFFLSLIACCPARSSVSAQALTELRRVVDGPSLSVQLRDGFICQDDDVPERTLQQVIRLELPDRVLQQAIGDCNDADNPELA